MEQAMNVAILLKASIKFDIHASFLEYLGVTDERATIGSTLYHFNIMDPAHPRYKSTVVIIHKEQSKC